MGYAPGVDIAGDVPERRVHGRRRVGVRVIDEVLRAVRHDADPVDGRVEIHSEQERVGRRRARARSHHSQRRGGRVDRVQRVGGVQVAVEHSVKRPEVHSVEKRRGPVEVADRRRPRRVVGGEFDQGRAAVRDGERRLLGPCRRSQSEKAERAEGEIVGRLHRIAPFRPLGKNPPGAVEALA